MSCACCSRTPVFVCVRDPLCACTAQEVGVHPTQLKWFARRMNHVLLSLVHAVCYPFVVGPALQQALVRLHGDITRATDVLQVCMGI